MSDVPAFGERVPGQAYVLRPSAYVVVFDGEHVATVESLDGRFLPGGGLEPGESPEDGARRECREECGFDVRILSPLGLADEFVFVEAEDTHFRKRSHVFFAARAEAAPSSEPDHQLRWTDVDEASKVLTHGSHRWALRRGRAARGHS